MENSPNGVFVRLSASQRNMLTAMADELEMSVEDLLLEAAKCLYLLETSAIAGKIAAMFGQELAASNERFDQNMREIDASNKRIAQLLAIDPVRL